MSVKEKKAGLRNPGWLFDISGHVKTSEVCSDPIKDQKNQPLLKTLDMQENSFPVLEQRGRPNWVSRSLAPG